MAWHPAVIFLSLLLVGSSAGCLFSQGPESDWIDPQTLEPGGPILPETIAVPTGVWSFSGLTDGALVFIQEIDAGIPDGARFRIVLHPEDPAGPRPWIVIGFPEEHGVRGDRFYGLSGAHGTYLEPTGQTWTGPMSSPGAITPERHFVTAFVASSAPVHFRIDLHFDDTAAYTWQPALNEGPGTLGSAPLHPGRPVNEHYTATTEHLFYVATTGDTPDPPAELIITVSKTEGRYEGELKAVRHLTDWSDNWPPGEGWIGRPADTLQINATYDGPDAGLHLVWMSVPLPITPYMETTHGLRHDWFVHEISNLRNEVYQGKWA